jgi:hypothetical protein
MRAGDFRTDGDWRNLQKMQGVKSSNTKPMHTYMDSSCGVLEIPELEGRELEPRRLLTSGLRLSRLMCRDVGLRSLVWPALFGRSLLFEGSWRVKPCALFGCADWYADVNILLVFLDRPKPTSPVLLLWETFLGAMASGTTSTKFK